MTAHDSQGVQVLDACRRAGIHVPDEVAVAGGDNEPVLCNPARPPALEQSRPKRPQACPRNCGTAGTDDARRESRGGELFLRTR